MIGGDVAPTNCFKALEAIFPDAFKVPAILGGGKPILLSESEIELAVNKADVLLLGLSASPESVQTELWAARAALKAGIPYGYYSDMALCPFRPWLKGEIADNASFVVGLLPEDMAELHKMYPQAHCVNTGNPLHAAMAFPAKCRDTIRGELGVTSDEKLILVAGNKFAAGNFQILSLVLETLERFPGSKYLVMFLPHPGDSTLRAIDKMTGSPLPLYSEMLDESSVRTLYATMPTPIAMAGADLVVDFTGDASVRAAYLRIPLINVVTEILLNRFEKEVGSRIVTTLKNGAGFGLPEFSTACLWDTITQLLNPSSKKAQNLYQAQVVAYPVPKDQNIPFQAIIEVIFSI